MIKVTNLVLNVNLDSPVIFFDIENITYALLTDGSEKVLDGDMLGAVELLSDQLSIDQEWETETTRYSFDEFIILDNNGELTLELT